MFRADCTGCLQGPVMVSCEQGNEPSCFIKVRKLVCYCVDKPTRCNTSYEWSLFSIIWLYMFRTIANPSSEASSLKLYNALVCSCRRDSPARTYQYIHTTATLACTNIPVHPHNSYTRLHERTSTSTQQLDSPDSTNVPVNPHNS